MSERELAERLREVFPRAWRDWREQTIARQEYDGIPWLANDLLEMLATDIERSAALRTKVGDER